MAIDFPDLLRRVEQSTGADTTLDHDLATAFAFPEAPFTASVPDCRALAASAMPGMKLHLGYGASGVFPYASLSGDGLHVVSEAATVPLAILRSLVGAAAARARSSPPAA